MANTTHKTFTTKTSLFPFRAVVIHTDMTYLTV